MGAQPVFSDISRADITASLRGSSFILPEFDQIYHGWPVRVNAHIDWLHKIVNYRIQSLLSQDSSFHYKDPVRKGRQLAAIDVPYLVSVWWPHASQETINVLACCALWLFMWDDEIDSKESSLGNNQQAAQDYRNTTLEYVSEQLGLKKRPGVQITPTTNILITSFSDIAAAVLSRPKDQVQRFYDEIEYWINSTEIEQDRRCYDSLPNLEDYVEVRMGTSGVRVLCILFDVLDGPAFESCPPPFNKSTVPNPVCRGLEALTDLTNLFISITNDILSVKKELAAGAPDSIIPILWLESYDLSAAVNSSVDILKSARLFFDKTERKVLKICDSLGDENKAMVKRYIESLKTMNSGNVAWSMRSKRYGLTALIGQQIKIVTL